jgi:UDP-N-acetylglucosamine 2-epimerase (non-hydrolysing)
VVVGTRPEAVKLAPLVLALRDRPDWEPVVITTGQHAGVVDEVLGSFGIVASVRHEPWSHSGALAPLHTALVNSLDGDLAHLDVDTVVVQGDTASALAGALAGFWRGIPVVDVEAGLRSGDLSAPFPEEANRQLISRVTALHLAPTAGAQEALAAEGITGDHVVVTGNTVIDALRLLAPPTDRRDAARAHRRVLVTCHRRENWGTPMAGVADAVGRLAIEFPDVMFAVATHPNPSVRAAFTGRLDAHDNVEITGPLDYAEFMSQLAEATIALTDSGGVQEEAPALGVPVLVLREVTERGEGVAAGVARLVGTDPEAIVAAASRLLSDPCAYAQMARATNPYGDGRAAERSIAAMDWFFAGAPRPEPFA